MADKRRPRTFKELTKSKGDLTSLDTARIERQLKLLSKEGDTLLKVFERNDKVLKDRIKNIGKYVDDLKEQKKILIELEKFRQIAARDNIKLQELIEERYKEVNKKYQERLTLLKEISEEELKQEKQTARRKRTYDLFYEGVEEGIKKVIRQSEDLYKVSHDLQLQGNMTWNQYTKLYNDSFDAIRAMNTAIGQSVFNTRQLFEAQQKLVPQGWKGIDTEHLTELSSAVIQIQAVLGTFPEELSTAFQMSYRQFGEATDNFVYAIGNRLNAFSDSFGVTVGALTGAVTQMMAANTFLARNNMQAQIMANESLMGAVALSSAVGIETSNFMVGLAQTSQFGTASQMTDLFQTGALLQGFSVQDFQSKMRSQDYMGATQDLIGSIQQTLGGMDEGYLRNEYIQRISQGFGLSQSDILQIMANDTDLAKKSLEIQEKLVDVDTSMEQELSDLNIALMDRFDNWYDSTPFSQVMGKFIQDHGLVGLDKHLNRILYAILGQSAQRTLWDSLISGGTAATAAGRASSSIAAGGRGLKDPFAAVGLFDSDKTAFQKAGRMAAGGGIALGGMKLGSSVFQDEGRSTTGSAVGGSLLNIGGGALGGVMAGSGFGRSGMIAGGILGGLSGGVKSIFDYQQRQKADLQRADDIVDAERTAAKATGHATDPLQAMMHEQRGTNQRLDKILGTMDYHHAEDMNFKVRVDMKDTASTKGT